jgi:capsular polysaccharide biosynthesis protein
MDGFKYVGYYDFVFLIAAKLCRIKECVSADDFSKAIISYPLVGTSYEQEYLELLGKKKTDVLDSRYNNIRFEKVILANSGHWFYPNSADVFAFKKYVENKLQVKKNNQNRIYVSRSGRRCIKNEKELIELLRKFGFIIIEDKPRSIFEQIEIYKNASFIIGPHGASFTNIIWCEPGTHLVELFSPNYVPDFFLYIATLMGMKYSAYYDSEKKNDYNNNDYKNNMVEDIFVSIPELEKYLLSFLVKIGRDVASGSNNSGV